VLESGTEIIVLRPWSSCQKMERCFCQIVTAEVPDIPLLFELVECVYFRREVHTGSRGPNAFLSEMLVE